MENAKTVDKTRLDSDLKYRSQFLADFILEVLETSGMEPESRGRTIRALNKLLWIQQSFISRHYV